MISETQTTTGLAKDADVPKNWTTAPFRGSPTGEPWGERPLSGQHFGSAPGYPL